MEQLAVFTAFTAALLLAANALPTISDHSSQLTDDAPTELHSLNQPRSQAKGVFGFSYNANGEHVIEKHYENTEEIEDMMFEVDDSSMEQENSEQYRKKRNAVSYLWPGGIIPYEIAPEFDAQERRIILQAIRHWEENTCIRFRPRGSDTYSIRIVTSLPGDCRSYLGRTRIRPQPLFLGPNCVRFSTAVHELGHAIGFYHEHSRGDRDEYVTILQNNVFPGITGAFGISSGNTLGLGYDYASIMHYSSRAFSRDGRSETIQTNQPNIPIGEAEELSPLDILKANRLYNCPCPLSPPNTVVPPALPPVNPSRSRCGTVEVLSGGEMRTVRSPGYPSHLPNQECAFVFQCPSGFLPQIEFPSMNLESSSGCTKDYTQIYFGSSLDSQDLIRYGGLSDGRICGNRYSRTRFFASTNTITVYYRTDSSGGSTGLQIKITCLDDDECRNARCDNCRNTQGSFECSCNKGYYFSKAATTCYDINECAYQNGGCEYKCVNMGGSYRCQCPPGQYVQSDGKSCGPRQSFPSLPIAPQLPSSCPVTPPPPFLCGGNLTGDFGSLQTPSWPATYPFNFDCEWNIQVPSPGCNVRLTFHSIFGIGGKTTQNCPKDYLKIYNNNGHLIRTICDLGRPFPITTTGNARLYFFAGPYHGPKRTGFRIEYTIACPTTLPPTTRPTTVATVTPGPTIRPTTRPTTTTTTTTLAPTTLPPPTPNCPVLPFNPQGTFGCGGFFQIGQNFGPTNLPFGPFLGTTKPECNWIIFGVGPFQVVFNYFDIPSSRQCSSNSVSVHDGFGTGSNSPLIEKMCGEKCGEYTVTGTGNIMTVTLRVSSPGSFRGFYAQFQQI
ncbi:dorsal-ventral patterning protein tolloid-like [Halichondria panicea]|uniref:dorsal-ventral patterning protein tolloid-like n=1 Tax=Halichondria panicea TaxID=6063 RepID=UPI00312B3309